MFYVYLHIKETNGEPFYVGKGKGSRGYSKHNRSKYWNNIVNKYNFDTILLEINLTEEDAFEKEKYWINRIGRDKLCNMTDGGEGKSCKKHTEEHKNNLSKKMYGNKINLNRTPWNKGLKYSNELKNKFSNAKKGNNCRSKKIIIDGVLYNSIKEASKLLNINYFTLAKRIRTKNKKHNYGNT